MGFYHFFIFFLLSKLTTWFIPTYTNTCKTHRDNNTDCFKKGEKKKMYIPQLIAENIEDNRFNNEIPVDIFQSVYAEDETTPAIFSMDKNNEPFATYTVNLSGYDIFPEPGNTFIKDYGEGEGGIDILVDNGIVEKVSEKAISFGPFGTTAWEVKIIA